MPYEFGIAETEEERRGVYRLRYDVYVDEMGRYKDIANHEERLFSEPEDEQSLLFYAREKASGDIVGTSRLTWGGNSPFPERMIRQYGMQPFLAELPPEVLAVGERGMVVPRLRGTDLMMTMMGQSRDWVAEKRIQIIFGNCEPHLLNLYLELGHRTYSHDNFNSKEAGYLIPILFVPEDVAYLRAIQSPLAEDIQDFGEDARVPAIVQRLQRVGSAVMSRTLTNSAAYWSEVYGALDELEHNRLSALDGLSDAEGAVVLEKSNIIECDTGDRVLKKGGVARNMFIVLEGMLEVRDGDAPIAVLGPGDVFGEMAFLLERPRSRDVYAATDGVRVLSTSESNLRELIESDPGIAAHLLLNISKMLCFRLLKRQ
jgi:hypothetical protein